MDWLPQNDLLAHKDIKAFVSHVGHNSLYESAYHGVPLVCFPLFGEQHTNAKKVEHFGFGLAVHHDRTNAEELYKTIELVESEPRYYRFCFWSLTKCLFRKGGSIELDTDKKTYKYYIFKCQKI